MRSLPLSIIAVIALGMHGRLIMAICGEGITLGKCLCVNDGDGSTSTWNLECWQVLDGDLEITMAVFGSTQNITLLDIYGSPYLETLPNELFGDTVYGHQFSLSDSAVSSIPNSIFGKSASVMSALNIKRNSKYSDFSGDTVAGMTSLESLYVSFSPEVTQLSGQMSSNSISHMDFSENNIASIDPNFFSKSSGIETLLLSHNKLTSDALEMFTLNFNSQSDVYLNLGYNMLSEGINSTAAFTDQMPKQLILSGNGITILNETIFEPLMTDMYNSHESDGYILLNDNPIICDCTIEWLTYYVYRDLLVSAICEDGRLIESLTPADFSDDC